MAATVCSALQADWKITTKETIGSYSSVRTEYFRSRLMRIDFHDGTTGSPAQVTIIDPDRFRYFAVDFAARQYTVRRLDYYSGHLRVSSSGASEHQPTLVVDIESTDTGQRRVMFGYMARHVLTCERRYSETSGRPPTDFDELLTEGWYIDAPSLPPHKRSGDMVPIDTVRASLPTIKVNRKGPIERGLAVWQSTKRVYPASSDKTGLEAREHVFEVTGLAEGELDPKLFAPPAGFQQVIQLRGDRPLSWSEKVVLGWEWLQDWWRGLLAWGG